MNAKQRKILQLIFKRPAPADMRWSDIESLFKSLGAEISEGNGSRVRIVLNGVRAVFHRPHPQREVDKGALVDVQSFLVNAGISYDEI